MSLKNIFSKSIASFLVTSMLLTNFSVFGIGLKQVIAEDVNALGVQIELKNEQYVQYDNGEGNKGVAVHSNFSINPTFEEEGYVPTKEVEIGINLPSLNEYFPTRARVVKASTIATTGEGDKSIINQSYDNTSGLLTVSYENLPDEEGNIYSEFKENAKDEFEIIYIYPAEAYTGNEQDVNLNYTVNVNAIFKAESDITTQVSKSIEIVEKENKGDLASFNITSLKEGKIYKGFMYSNVQNKTNYDTEYNTVSTLCVLNKDVLAQEVSLEIKESQFILNDEEKTKVSTNGNIVYKSTEINKNEFDNILGQDGSIKAYIEENTFIEVAYVQVDEQETKKLAVKYSEEDIRILADDATSAVIEYPDNITSLKFEVSKPIAEGYINFENKNVIKASDDYKVNIEDIKYIFTESVVEETLKEQRIELLEPQTKVSIESSQLNFSTFQNTKTTITIKLDNTKSSAKLFDSPTFEMKLPQGLKTAKIGIPRIVDGNGLKLTNSLPSVDDDKRTVRFSLSGKQTSYDINNINGGTSIVMDVEMEFYQTTPTHNDKIELTCIQGNEEVKSNVDVKVLSKSGLLILSDYNNENTVIDNDLQEIEIEAEETEKSVYHKITLINNYAEDLNDLKFVQTLGYADETNTSNFEVTLSKPVQVTANARIFYSTNINAEKEDGPWDIQFSNNVKAYMIVLQEKLEAEDYIEVIEYLNIPDRVGYNKQINLKSDIKYFCNEETLRENFMLRLKTQENDLTDEEVDKDDIFEEDGKEIPVELAIIPNISQNYVHSGQTVTYKVRVTNKSEQDLTNLVLKDIIPENAIYTYMKEIEDDVANYYEKTQDESIKEKVWNIDKLRAGQTKEFEIMLTMKDVIEEQEINNVVKLEYNGQELTLEKELILKQALIQTNLTTNAEQIIGMTYKAGQELKYYIKVKNITSNELKNIDVKYEIPTELTYVEGGESTFNEFYGYILKKSGNISNNLFEYNIEKLASGEEKDILITVKVNQLNGVYQKDITTNAKIYISNDIYETNIKTITTKQAAFEIFMSANTNGKDVLEKDDIVIYTIRAKNIGVVSNGINITDSLPEKLEVSNVEYYVDENNKYKFDSINSDILISTTILPNEELTIDIIAKVKDIESEDDNLINIINKAVLTSGELKIQSNEVSLNIKPELKVNEELDNPSQEPENPNPEGTGSQNPGQGGNEEQQPGENNPGQENNNTVYSISGVAWLDINKNGRKDENEKLLENITVSIVDKATGKFVFDEAGNRITVKTDSTGKYTFNNLVKGTYVVLFEFDTENYTVTTYKKSDVDLVNNSDVILSTVNINGEKKLAAITDSLLLNSNKGNVDIGLIENPKFDLSLNKEITKITVVNKEGTKEYKYDDGETAKVDLVAKYMAGSNVIVTYKFTIKNEADVTGYVEKLVDDLPSGLEFSSEMNKDWYKGNNGKLYLTALSKNEIKPGESIEVELVLTKTMTEDNVGVFPNNASLEKISNLEGIEEKEGAKQNNESSATLIISIKTGSAILYIGITLTCIAIICAGAYIIKKKVLNGII